VARITTHRATINCLRILATDLKLND